MKGGECLKMISSQDYLPIGYDAADEDIHYALEENEDTYTLVFRFDDVKLRMDNLSADVLLQPMRTFAKDNGIQEVKTGIFQSAGKDAFALLTMIVPKICYGNIQILKYLSKWKMYNRYEISDAKTASISWFMNQEPQSMAELGLCETESGGVC